MAIKDITLVDNNRRDISLLKTEIISVLPEHYVAEYPDLIQLLEDYYDWMEQEGQPVYQIHNLLLSRDITQTPTELLPLIEDELLLGNAYFQGFQNKREAAKFSSTLYKSKGTKFSVEQFFRGFFNEDPDVIYPRNNIFVLNDPSSQIGPTSLRYLTDDKLYQPHSILIRSGIPRGVWEQVYKLFVHPAGMYLGSEIVLVGANEAITTLMPLSIPADPAPPIYEGLAFGSLQPFGDITRLVYDNDNELLRQTTLIDMHDLQNVTYAELDGIYNSIQELVSASGPTFDRDSDQYGHGINFSDDRFETFDLSWYDSAYDSSGKLIQLV